MFFFLFFPFFLNVRKQFTLNDLEDLVKKMHTEWRVLSLTDLVFNHTSKDSPWLWEHPECAYNLENSPHLRPAYILDCALRQFSDEVAENKWASKGIPAKFCQCDHLEASVSSDLRVGVEFFVHVSRLYHSSLVQSTVL